MLFISGKIVRVTVPFLHQSAVFQPRDLILYRVNNIHQLQKSSSVIIFFFKSFLFSYFLFQALWCHTPLRSWVRHCHCHCSALYVQPGDQRAGKLTLEIITEMFGVGMRHGSCLALYGLHHIFLVFNMSQIQETLGCNSCSFSICWSYIRFCCIVEYSKIKSVCCADFNIV